MILSLHKPTPYDSLPGFGQQHLRALEKEALQAQINGRMVLALAHGTRYRDDSMDDFLQHSTVFIICPHDADVLLRIGDQTLFHGHLIGGNIYWMFVNWNQIAGDLVLVNGSTYTIPRQRIMQRTLMECILWHPRMDVSEAANVTA